ncbi:fungal-specific transcription factor domain-containing protein [Kalaharituber pfeilii]|nr:fungal-specific transcription factor domain-containing protein [Kalaharituber pfeilii]
MQPKAPKTSTKTHRRSRTGCFTCRLRRKKCDEGKPLCKACKHLGLNCEYKRPVWWSNVDQRKRQKEAIKMLIKRTKLSEKAQVSPLSADSPPELSRSAPTSDCTSDRSSQLGLPGSRRRSLSIESGYSLENDLDDGLYGMPMDTQQLHAFHAHPHTQHAGYPFGAFDVDVITEKQTFVNSFPVRKNSSAFTTTAFRRPSYGAGLSVAPGDTTFNGLDGFHSNMGSPEMEGIENFQFLDFAFGQPTPSSISTTSELLSSTTSSAPCLPVEDSDRQLFDHFLASVVRLIFPILDISLRGMATQEVVLPALATNKCYMHCCLSVAALHLKSTQQIPSEYIDQDIMRHRYATISELCETLKNDTDHLQILEATLAMILFQCVVGHPDDTLPDIPWHSHFQAATSLVHKLNLTQALNEITAPGGIPAQYAPAPINMTLTAWVDILGATMLGRAPQFADTYREKHLCRGYSGLMELMGCDDQVMYLISEIACLEALKNDNMLSDMDLCEHVKSLASKIDETEDIALAASGGLPVGPIVRSDGGINQTTLAHHMTDAFRYAARIYLCSLVPGFDRNQIQVKELLNKLVATLERIPGGVDGFDRSLVWVYLIGGSVSTQGSLFRQFLYRRNDMLGAEGTEGSWGRMFRLLGEVWRLEDNPATAMGGCRWRDVMVANGWDFLMI